MNAWSFQESVTNAIHYWERGRIAYNAMLLILVGGVFALDWPRSATALSFETLQGLFVLAGLANVAYCAAYPVDLLVQASDYRAQWLRMRWMLLLVGTLFAGAIAQFVARPMLGTGA